jgi:hypothetical protein
MARRWIAICGVWLLSCAAATLAGYAVARQPPAYNKMPDPLVGIWTREVPKGNFAGKIFFNEITFSLGGKVVMFPWDEEKLYLVGQWKSSSRSESGNVSIRWHNGSIKDFGNVLSGQSRFVISGDKLSLISPNGMEMRYDRVR